MDYADIAERSWEEIPEAKTLPDGQWRVVGGNVSLIKPREEGGSFKVLWNYKAAEPLANVDQEALDDLGTDYDITTNDLTFTQYIERAADWSKVKKHAELHGIELDLKSPIIVDGKLSFAKSFRNSTVVATLGTRTYEKDGETHFDNSMSKFLPVAE